MIIHATKVTFKCLAVEKGHALHSIPMQSSNQKKECYVTFPHWKAYMPLCLWNYCTCFDIFLLLFIYSSKQHDTAVFILARGWCWTELHDSRANNEILFVSTIVYWYFTFSIITFSIYKTMDIIWTIQASTSQLKHLTWSHEAHYSFFSDVVKKPGYRGLLQWVRSIVNRFWWRCSTCKGIVNRLLKRWISILHHIQRKVFGQVDVKYCFEFILM